MAAAGGVIDWDEAMEQCGDDEEFLRELLADLRGETDAQVTKIEETIRVRRFLRQGSVKNFSPFMRSPFIPYSTHTTEPDRSTVSSNNAGVSCDQGRRFEPHVWAVANCSDEFGAGGLSGE